MVLLNGAQSFPQKPSTSQKSNGKSKVTPEPPPSPWSWASAPDFKIEQIGEIEILKAYRMFGYPRCPYFCKKNCKKNPYCLWGLGYRNWQDKSGTNAEIDNSDDRIVGIKNLGNTCYVNSLLQLWFHNPIICPIVLQWRPPEESSSSFIPCCAISNLQAMFARMKTSKQRAIDARAFVGALQLNPTEQQDAQEFSKLLLQKIMENLIENRDKISQSFKTCFTGELQFETVCDKCHYKSTGGKEDFTELTLPVRDTLTEALAEVCWQESKLENDNQYFCRQCKVKQDATRSMKVLKLPQVLNIQLLRFVYDTFKGDRRKVQKSIKFPEILDMTEYVPEEYHLGQDFVYQLNGVLIHKGEKVTQGHYIARIKDVKSGKWFECNDDSIEKIEKSKSANSEESSQEEEKGLGTSNQTSTGAYLLVYTRQKEFVQPNPDIEVPNYLKQLIHQEELKFDIEEAKKVERQTIIQELFQDMVPAPSVEKENEQSPRSNIKKNENQLDFRNMDFIPVSWMEKLLDNKATNVPVLSTSELLCEHGNMKCPKRTETNVPYKIVSSSFADRIYDKYGSTTTRRLRVLDSVCGQCVSIEAKLINDLATLEFDNKEILRLIKEVDNAHNALKNLPRLPEEFTSDKLWIGKETLRSWKKYARRNIENLNPAAVDDECQEMLEFENYVFNNEVLCDHGQLSGHTGNRKLINLQAWSILMKYFPDAAMYSFDHDTCGECLNDEAANSVVIQQNKELAHRQRQSLNDLYLNKFRPSPLHPGTYYLVPTSFVQEWRRFIKYPATNDSLGIVPTSQLLCSDPSCSCEKPSLRYNLEAWLYLSHVYHVDDPESKITLIRESEMNVLRNEMEFEMELQVNVSKNENDTCNYVYNVGICQRSINDWTESVENEAYYYSSGNIYIKLIDDEAEVLTESTQLEPPAKREKLDLKSFTPGNSRRVLRDRGSRLTRSAQMYKSLPSHMTIRDFQIANLMKDHKAMLCDQHLYFNSRELSEADKLKTFGELKISSNSTIFLRIDKLNGQADYGERDEPSQTERGFLGTALASTFPVQNGNSNPTPTPSLNLC